MYINYAYNNYITYVDSGLVHGYCYHVQNGNIQTLEPPLKYGMYIVVHTNDLKNCKGNLFVYSGSTYLSCWKSDMVLWSDGIFVSIRSF
jgi:hypothetical protein